MADYTRATKMRRRRAKPSKKMGPDRIKAVDAMKGPRPSARALDRANPNARFKRTEGAPKVKQQAKAISRPIATTPVGTPTKISPRPIATTPVGTPVKLGTSSKIKSSAPPVAALTAAKGAVTRGKSATAPGQMKKKAGVKSARTFAKGRLPG